MMNGGGGGGGGCGCGDEGRRRRSKQYIYLYVSAGAEQHGVYCSLLHRRLTSSTRWSSSATIAAGVGRQATSLRRGRKELSSSLSVGRLSKFGSSSRSVPEQKQLDVHVPFAKVRKKDIATLPAPTSQAAFPMKNLPFAAPKRCRASESDSEETAYKTTAKSAASMSEVRRPRRAAAPADQHVHAELSGSGSEGLGDST
jgi:hypothetical protein